MSGGVFGCPYCGEHLAATSGAADEVVTCPRCGRQSAPPGPTVRYPLVVRSSTRAMYAKYVAYAFFWGLTVPIVVGITWYLGSLGRPEASAAIPFLWGASLILLFITLVRLWFDYRRIKHTEYRIFPNKIEVTSYLFRFLGAYNNVVNLTQLRQLHAAVNTYLDLWFFGCGKVTLTVSGDVADFELTNVYRPTQLRRRIEAVVFGRDSVSRGAGPAPEVDDGG